MRQKDWSENLNVLARLMQRYRNPPTFKWRETWSEQREEQERKRHAAYLVKREADLVKQILRSPVRDRRVWLGILFFEHDKNNLATALGRAIYAKIMKPMHKRSFHAWKRLWAELVDVEERGRYYPNTTELEYRGFHRKPGNWFPSIPSQTEDGESDLAWEVLEGMLHRATTPAELMYLVQLGIQNTRCDGDDEPADQGIFWFAYLMSLQVADRLWKLLSPHGRLIGMRNFYAAHPKGIYFDGRK